jgi:metal-dependent HD superfamily phosphatase/phosphodiesterase
MDFTVPVGQNHKLKSALEAVRSDIELQTYWRCSNVVAIDRLHINDHGPTHIKIMANVGLRILRLLVEKGVSPNIVQDYGLKKEDAEVVVFLGCCLHDVGHVIHRANHADYSIPLSIPVLDRLLDPIYSAEEKTIVKCETLHAIRAHEVDVNALTIEAGVVRISDALDMERGRARVPFSAGSISIHSVSAMAIDKVEVRPGTEDKPVEIQITMSNSAGIFQIDELLKKKLKNSMLENLIRFDVNIQGEQEKKIIEKYELKQSR